MSKKVLLSYHSQYTDLAKQISKGLLSRDIDILLVSEDAPATLAEREQAVQWCDVFIVLASVKYQRSVSCMELLNYSRERRVKRPLVTIVGQHNYHPNGALGALSVCGPFVEHYSVGDYNLISSVILSQSSSSKGPKPTVSENGSTGGGLTGGQGAFISWHEENSWHAQFLSQNSQVAIKRGDPHNDNSTSIDACKVFIALMGPGYQDSPKCQKEYDRARLAKKHIIPVKTSKDFRPSGWLALAIAGKLYHSIFDHAQATTAFYDSNPLKDFVYTVGFMLQSQYTEEEREQLEMNGKQKQLHEAQQRVASLGGQWPPRKRAAEVQGPPVQIRKEDLVIKQGDNLPMNYIHHEVTRMGDFKPPKPLFNPHGVPIKQKFDCMISYQWDIQRFVRDFYQDLHMRNLSVWMDIYGDMQGNINDAMSNGIESSKCIISFLTKKYLESANCNIEIQYALRKNKPIIFINVEQDLDLPPWMQQKYNESLNYNMTSISDSGKMIDGIPQINRISEAVRRVVQLTIKDQKDEEMTEEVWVLHDQLEDALQLISELQGKKRFETCTRCGAEFDENAVSGCKKHGAYYMGGTIMAGRWVCCSQREKAGLGCQKTNHTTAARRWTPIQGGCHKWVPE